MRGLPAVHRRVLDDGMELEFTLAVDNPWLEGHFPGRPILPGVVQIGWAAHYAALLRGDDTPPLRLERVKFKHPAVPGARLCLRLQRMPGKVRYRYRLLGPAAPVEVSSGTLCYAEEA